MFDLTKIVRTNILALEPYSSARDEFEGNEGIFLDANENPFGELNRYPDPLQKAVKDRLSEVKGIPAQNIFLGNGSDEIIDLCFRVFCEPGKDKVLTFVPTYGMYEVSAAINNVALIKVSLDVDFQIDMETATPLLADPSIKMIFVCSPNNPTGNIIYDVENLIQSFKGIVVVDEAYIDFAESESVTSKLAQYPNLIVLQTLSKAWGLAAARVGIAYAGIDVIKYLNKVKPPYNISTPNQSAALYTLQDIAKYELQKNIILQEKEKMLKEVEKLEYVVKIYPSETNFFLAEVNNADSVYKQLINQQIIVRNRHKIVKNCLRITVGTPTENEALLAALKNIEL